MKSVRDLDDFYPKHGRGFNSCLRSRRPGNDDEVNVLETCFARRHHPRSSGLPKERGQNRGVEMR